VLIVIRRDNGRFLSPERHSVTDVSEDVELTMVTLRLEAADEAASAKLLGVLAKYVVITRGHEGCRNIDLVASVTHPGRYLLVQKWDSPDAQRAHFDSPDMVEMAEACRGLLATAPDVDLWDGMSAHDLA
jgi:quinol monooxygenase YgiN